MLCYSFTGSSAKKIIKRNGRYREAVIIYSGARTGSFGIFPLEWNITNQKGVEQQPPSPLIFLLCGIGILMARVRQTPTTAGRVWCRVRTRKGETNFRARSRVWNYSQLKSRLLRLPPYSPRWDCTIY